MRFFIQRVKSISQTTSCSFADYGASKRTGLS